MERSTKNGQDEEGAGKHRMGYPGLGLRFEDTQELNPLLPPRAFTSKVQVILIVLIRPAKRDPLKEIEKR